MPLHKRDGGAFIFEHNRNGLIIEGIGFATATAQGTGQGVTYALKSTSGEGEFWDAALWLTGHAALAVETAVEVMARYGQTPPARLHARL